ncbi:MAG: polysaccharide biosynthesis C-terminal domain-containing protein [Acidimicrobiales bacterium]
MISSGGRDDLEGPNPPASDAREVESGNSIADAAGNDDGSRTVIRGSLALFSTQPITWMISALSVAFIPHYLTARELGFASVATSIAALAGLFAGLGVSNIIVRELGAGTRKDSFAGAAFVLIFFASVVVAVIVEAVLLVVGMRGLQLRVCEIALVAMVLSTPATVIGCKIIAERRFAVYAWMMVLTSLAVLASIIALMLGTGLIGASLAGLAMLAASVVVNWHLAQWKYERAWLDRKVWRQLARGGLPFIGLSVATWVYADGAKLLLNVLAGPEAIGWHAAAMRIPAVMVFIPTLLATPLMPTLSRQRGNPLAFNQTLSTTLLTAVTLTVPISAGVFGAAARIPDVLGWSDTFSHSIPLMRILVFEQPIVAADILLGTAVIALGSERRLLFNTTVAAIASISMNVVLIPIFKRHTGNGAIGSDIAQLVTEVLLMILILRALPRKTFGRPFVSKVTRVVIAGIAMGAVVQLLAPHQLIAAGAAGIFVYGAALLILRVFAFSDIGPAGAVLVRGVRQKVKRS